ncbi:MAG: glycosyltransferase family 2 protein [Chitinophagaceae bacterium]|nr:glycosyltransferase family 2 protein [Chitinophagaceae bacterium]
MSESNPRVAIIILNWNGKKFLEQFLPSVLNTQYENLEIVVADNGSTDDSVSFLKDHYPSIRVILLETNYGFAGGYNLSLQQIEADYFALLNSDAEVTPGWVKSIVDLMESDYSIAACQPKILSFNDRNRFEYAGASGGWIDKWGYPFCRGRVFYYCEEDKGQFNNAIEVFWATGAAMIVRSSLFLEFGGFDDYFFAHQEEIDLCWRMKNKGYKIYVQPSSVVYHMGGGSLGQDNPHKLFLNFRNNLIMMYKNLRSGERIVRILMRMVFDGIAGIRFLLSGKLKFFLAVIKAHFAFYRWIFLAKKDRAERKPLKELAGVYNGSVVWDYFLRKKKTFSEIVGTKK